MNYYPLLRARSSNNGMHCMFFCILMYIFTSNNAHLWRPDEMTVHLNCFEIHLYSRKFCHHNHYCHKCISTSAIVLYPDASYLMALLGRSELNQDNRLLPCHPWHSKIWALFEVMVCCQFDCQLRASHYLNHCWLIVNSPISQRFSP